MKKTKLFTLLTLVMFGASLTAGAVAMPDGKEKKKKKGKTEVVATPKKTPEQIQKEKYDKLLKGATKVEGVFTTHFTKDGNLYFEIDKNLEDRVFLISNRISSTTDTRDMVAGQMVIDPFMVRFTVDTSRVVMYRVQSNFEVDENDPIRISFDRNIGDPILKTFKPQAINGNKVVIDVTAFFGTDEKAVSPLMESSPISMMFGGKAPISGRFVKDDSYITSVKTFPENIEIKSLLNYDKGGAVGYTLNVHRSVVLLPKTPMVRRTQDNRVGYFSSRVNQFSSKKDGMTAAEYIHRWRLEPKDEDMADYYAGVLVEPKKQIVFYVDNAFPEKWRETVIQGVKDWNIAFEAAGFKNAITARMYPTKEENPDFDPDDMRFSCIKYATTNIANAMGPSHVDPRSGEILTGDVIWYHNVVSLVHNWRFVQTAAVDPRVRKSVFDDELMCESLRYVTSHEVGHTLGLMHNMGASYSYPVDSLRSASFTKVYGTTPSIMDYARNNYVAQPGDLEKGVRMTPPILGVYDVHAINWGYRLFKDNEKQQLSEVILSKDGDDMYRFGAQQIFGTIDPTDQTEDLGDNHIKAGDLCIKNLKIILANLEDWHGEDGKPYDDLISVYDEVIKQYLRVVMHVIPEIGGVAFKEVMQGEDAANKTVRYFTKEEQKNAMKWIVNQSRTYLDWLTPKYVTDRFPFQNILPNKNDLLGSALTGTLFSHTAMGRMYDASVRLGIKGTYTVDGYVEDLMSTIFEPTINGKKLTSQDMNIESTAIDYLVKLADIMPAEEKAKGKKSLADIAEESFAAIQAEVNKPVLSCSYDVQKSLTKHSCCDAHADENSFARVNMSQTIAPMTLTKPLFYNKLKWVKKLYENKRAGADAVTRNYYDYQILKMNNILNK